MLMRPMKDASLSEIHFGRHASLQPVCARKCYSILHYRRDFAEAKFRYSIALCSKQIKLNVALSETLRYTLGLEQAQRVLNKRKIMKQTKAVAKLRACCRDEIYYERAHSARLELWAHIMLASFTKARKALSHSEALLEQQKIIDMLTQKALRSELWRQLTAAQTLSMDVSALFLFFAQRLASMSGARRSFNDAFRF